MGWTHNRARLAALTRHRNPDDPALSDARRDFAAERLAEVVRRVVDAAPPLTAQQRDTIATLLRAPAQRGAPPQRTAKTFTRADVDRRTPSAEGLQPGSNGSGGT